MNKYLNISVFTSISWMFFLITSFDLAQGQESSYAGKLFKVIDKKTNKPLKNSPITIEIPTKPKEIKSTHTDSEGFCFIKANSKLPSDSIKLLRVEGYNIIGKVNDRGEVLVEKKIISDSKKKEGKKTGPGGNLKTPPVIDKAPKKDTTITKQKLKAFEREKQKLIEQKDSLNKEIEKLKEQDKVSKADIERLDQKIKEFEKSTLHFLSRFRKEVLEKFDLDDSTSTEQLKLGNPTANKIIFDNYLNKFKKAYAEQKRLERDNRYLAISVIMGLLSIIGLLLWVRYRNKKYARKLQDKNSQLGQQKEELEQQSTKLEQQNTQLGIQKTTLEKQGYQLKEQNTQLETQKATLEGQKVELEHQKVQLEQQATKLEQQNTLLIEQKTILEVQKGQLEKNTVELEEQISQLNSQEYLIKLLLSEMKHRVGNDLTSIQFKIDSVRDKIEDDDTKVKDYLLAVKDHIRKLINMQESLNYSFSSDGQLEKLSTQEVDLGLKNIANTLFNFHFDDMNRPEIALSVSVENLIKSRFALISFCVFELINNACKYAMKNNNGNPQKVKMRLTKETEYVKLVIETTGKGISPKLFGEEGFLFDNLRISKGMKIVKKITEVENGDFDVYTVGVHDKIKEGSRFECTYKH